MTEQTITWEGAEALRSYLVPIEELKDTEGNPEKEFPEKVVGELMGSLKRWGQVRPILTDSEDKLTIRAGHHLRKAMRELGWTHVAAIPHEFSDSEEAYAYVLADNILGQLGTMKKEDQMSLIDLVGEENLEGTGLSIDDAENLRAALSAVPEVSQVEPWEGGYSESPEEAAARAAAIGQQEPHKEVVLLLTLGEYEVFGAHIRHLQKQWGTTGIKESFLRAVEYSCMDEDGGWPEGLASHTVQETTGDDLSVSEPATEEVPSPHEGEPEIAPEEQATLEELAAEVEDTEPEDSEPGFLS
jgi:hypothetical protein